MPTLTESAPVLFVRDVVAAAHHYRDVLGFRLGRFWGEPPSFTIIARDRMHVMLKQVDPGQDLQRRTSVQPGMWDMYFWTDDADALFAELEGRGAVVDYAPCDQSYGCREFGVQDLDGHHIGFGQVVAPPS